MKLKYFNELGLIKKYYVDVLQELEHPTRYSENLLKTWNITIEDKESILEEYEVIRYLISLKVGIALTKNTEKPTLDIVNRCFNRQLQFLDLIFKCNDTKHKKVDEITKKTYSACIYYIEKFKDKNWVDNLPNTVLTYQNRYEKNTL